MTGHLELVQPHTARAEQIWCALERLARPSYFLTWGWISNWLAMLPDDEAPQLAVIRQAGALAGAFFLGRRRLLRHHLVPSRAAFLNATGDPRYDELCIEHNGIVGRGCSLATLVETLPGDWDELFLPGVDRAQFPDLAVPHGYHARVEFEIPSPYVDLARVRAAGDYLRVVSGNTRSQLRRAQRRVGPRTLEVAASLDEATTIYNELVALHTASWHERGEPGAFADPWFDQFHRRLIAERFTHGEIQLVRLRAGAATLGCLYNFVSSGHVAFYQSGLATWEDPVVKPGLLCHAAAIARCAEEGHAVYDLLGGHARYKASLATDETPLAWLRVQRTRLRFSLEDRVRSWKRALATVLA